MVCYLILYIVSPTIILILITCNTLPKSSLVILNDLSFLSERCMRF